MYEVTLRFKTEDKELVDNLVVSWLENEGVTLHHGGGRDFVDLTYVKERKLDD